MTIITTHKDIYNIALSTCVFWWYEYVLFLFICVYVSFGLLSSAAAATHVRVCVVCVVELCVWCVVLLLLS